jgi:hypothetical protein
MGYIVNGGLLLYRKNLYFSSCLAAKKSGWGSVEGELAQFPCRIPALNPYSPRNEPETALVPQGAQYPSIHKSHAFGTLCPHPNQEDGTSASHRDGALRCREGKLQYRPTAMMC